MPDRESRRTIVSGHGQPETPRGGPRFRAALLVGAGLTLGVWLFAGVYFGQRIARVQEQVAEVSQRYLRAQQLLTGARNQVLLSAVYMREALLDPSDESVADREMRVSIALDSAEEALARYVPVLGSVDEEQRVALLRSEIAEFHREMAKVLATDRRLWRGQAGALLRERLMPRRESVMRVADELGTLNRTEFVALQVQTATIYRTTQLQVWQMLGMAITASLAIVGLAALYAGRLERRVRSQQERDAEMQVDLHRLSAALIRAREAERRSLARELHDEIGQLLTAAKVELAVAQSTVQEGGGPTNLLDDAKYIVDRTLQAVRDLSGLLHPSVLDDLGLVAAVDWQVKAIRRRHNIAVTFVHDVDRRLRTEVEMAAYRIVQEALTNVVKYAHSTSCLVSLTCRNGRLMVEVEDDGRGFSSIRHVSRPNSLGLISIRERVTQLGGMVVIESGPNLGTRIVVELPIDPSSPVAAGLDVERPL